MDIKITLAISLRDLLENQSLQNISVRQIAHNCNLSTRSFYNYFSDKYDLANFIYYAVSEIAWYHEGLPRNLEQAYDAFGQTTILSYSVWKNMFKYIGQNNIREFVLTKTSSDLCRLFLWNNCGHMLQERQTQEVIAFISHGLTNMLSQLICNADPLCTISTQTLLACIPEAQRNVITADLTASPLHPQIPIFNIHKPIWPAKLYNFSSTEL